MKPEEEVKLVDDVTKTVHKLIKDEDDELGPVNLNAIEKDDIHGEMSNKDVLPFDDDVIIKKKSEIRDERLKKQSEQLAREKHRRAILSPFVFIGKFLSAVFNPHTYVKIIQKFENLLLTIFVDSLMLFIIVVLAYISYSLVRFESDGTWNNIVVLLVKIFGGFVVAAICIWSQYHIHIPLSQQKNGEEE